MKDRESGRVPDIKEKGEQARPLTVTLSEKVQLRIFNEVKGQLTQITLTEIMHREKPMDPKLRREIEEMRDFARAIVNNLGFRINPKEALDLGMSDLVPREQLGEWATSSNVDFALRLKAKYFYEKEGRKEAGLKPKE